MKKHTKFISMLLAVLMLCGSVAGVSSVTVFAADDVSDSVSTVVTDTYADHTKETDFTALQYGSPEDKLAAMQHRNTTGNYEMYAHPITGEVAVKNTVTGQVLFTNPYDVAASQGSTDVKNELMSQLVVTYLDNGTEKVFNSYAEAAQRGQIKVKNIKHGVRVEYTIGREATKRLVPEVIRDEVFQAQVLTPLRESIATADDQHDYNRFLSFFQEKKKEELSKEEIDMYPMLKMYDHIWVFDNEADGAATGYNFCEEKIMTFCADTFTYEDLEAEYLLLGYEPEDGNPPVFKMALEYVLDKEDGLSVRLPANGIRFNESLYQLSNISVLPYMGAGNSAYSGYTFFPDGSGALFSFEDLDIAAVTTISSKVYGTDYAYQKLTGTYQETVRYPVFGVVENTEYYEYRQFEDEAPVRLNAVVNEQVQQLLGSGKVEENQQSLVAYRDAIKDKQTFVDKVTESRGYMAIIEEGDALAEIQTYHAGMTGDYNSIKLLFNPRPSDSYNLADAISVGENTEWTVVSSRKYVDNYKIRYTMLTDDQVAAEKGLAESDYYPTTWLGMAFAYRDYLTKPDPVTGKPVLTPLTGDAVDGDIPLYIESFGAIEATEKILSIPVEVMKPLTTFEDIKTMYDKLSAAGVSNINFKLTGYAEGGIYSSVPSKIDWENVLEKSAKTDGEVEKDGAKENISFQDLLDYAASLEEGQLGIYPDFEFSYSSRDTMFDKLSKRNHVVKTIDDRYASRREYSPTMQKYVSYFQLAISPAYFDVFYKSLTADYEKKYDNLVGMSVGSLGNTLNSDFDEDEPYNREDSKNFVIEALEYLSGSQDGNMQIMVDGGNAYTWSYVDHILNAPLDSSRYIKASYSVPFVGVVLHGYKNFAGAPLNMEGDMDYALLKAIENGSSIYFTLSYRNTRELKNDHMLSQYYSIQYDIWQDDVIEIYNELNAEMKDVQDKLIVGHEFLDGTRVADSNELAEDLLKEFNAALEYQQNKEEHELQELRKAMVNARENVAKAENMAELMITVRLNQYSSMSGLAYKYQTSYYDAMMAYQTAETEYARQLAAYQAASDEDKADMKAALDLATSDFKTAQRKLKTTLYDVKSAYNTCKVQYNELLELKALAEGEKGAGLIEGTDDCPESIKAEIREQLDNTEEMMIRLLGIDITYSPNKLEAETFLNAHIADLLTDITESNKNLSSSELVQLTFEIIREGNVGLSVNDLDNLRYFAANKSKSDAELMAKYGIPAEGYGSNDGVVLYLKELLAETAADAEDFEANVLSVFDPYMSMEDVDAFLELYYKTALYTERVNAAYLPQMQPLLTNQSFVVTDMNTAVVSQINVLKAVYYYPTYSEMNEEDQKACIEAVKKMENPSDLAMMADDAALDQVVMALEAALVASQDKIKNEQLKETYVSTATSREFLKTYFVEYYYSVHCANPYSTAVKLDDKMVSITSTVEASLKKMYEARYKALLTGENTEAKLQEILADEAFVASLEQIVSRLPVVVEDEKLVPVYGSADEMYDILVDSFKAIAADKASNALPTKAYYYDVCLGQMDMAVYEDLVARLADVRNDADGKNAYEVWNSVLALIADTTNSDGAKDSLSTMIAIAAAFVEYGDEQGKSASVEKYVRQYVYGQLFSFLDTEYKLKEITMGSIVGNGKDEKELRESLEAEAKAWAAALAAEAVNNSKRGQIPNYALDDAAFKSVTTKATEMALQCMDEDAEGFTDLVAKMEEYLLYTYYQVEVRKNRLVQKTDITKVVKGEYCDIFEASERVIGLLDYYTMTFTDMTQEELNAIGKKETVIEEEEVEEFDKYSSDKGKLVAVTYGDKNSDGSYSKFKTFLLNYNDFSVRVWYGDKMYTIPAYGYVSLYV